MLKQRVDKFCYKQPSSDFIDELKQPVHASRWKNFGTRDMAAGELSFIEDFSGEEEFLVHLEGIHYGKNRAAAVADVWKLFGEKYTARLSNMGAVPRGAACLVLLEIL